MTELQILRGALFDEISRVKRGTTTVEDVNSIAKLSNSIIQSYNTEIKGFEMLLKAKENSIDVPVLIFQESNNKIELKDN